MIEHLINEFKVILSESDWMDPESKQKALEKVHLRKEAFISFIFESEFQIRYN